MKKVIPLILLLMMVAPATALAAPADVEAGLGPDSRFYWFDRMAERITLLFTLDPQAKSTALSKNGLERLAEAGEVEDEETVGKLVSEYVKNQEKAQDLAGDDIDALAVISEDQGQALEQLNDLIENGEGVGEHEASKALTTTARLLERQANRLEKIAAKDLPGEAEKAAKVIDKTTTRLSRLADKLAKKSDDSSETVGKKTVEELSDHVLAATAKHLEVLERVLENAPDSARSAIEAALDNSAKGQGKASEAVKRRGPKADGDSDDNTDTADGDDGGPSSKGRGKRK